MQTCAYCGRRLPWLHRAMGAAPYCSSRCARKHREASGSKAADAPVSRQPREDPAPSELSGETPTQLQPIFETSRGDGDPAAPEAAEPARDCIGPPVLPVDPAVADPGFRTRAPAGLEPEEPAAAASKVAEAPDAFEPVRPGAVALTPAPAGLPVALLGTAWPLRPRRRIVVPTHRPSGARPGLCVAGAVDPALRAYPAGGRLPDSGRGIGFSSTRTRHDSAMGRPASCPSPDAPLSVVILSFEESGPSSPRQGRTRVDSEAGGAPLTGRATGAGAEPIHPKRDHPALPSWPVFPAPAPRKWPVRRPVSRPPSVFSGACLPALSHPAAVLYDDQAALVQPFRLHRMPLRPLRIGPRRGCHDRRHATVGPLAGFAFAVQLLAPRPLSMPLRPLYRLLPRPDDGAGSALSGAATAPPAGRHHGG